MAKSQLLTPEHVKKILELDIVIGSDVFSGKQFVFNPQKSEFVIYVHGRYLRGWQDMEALLIQYNEIK